MIEIKRAWLNFFCRAGGLADAIGWTGDRGSGPGTAQFHWSGEVQFPARGGGGGSPYLMNRIYC